MSLQKISPDISKLSRFIDLQKIPFNVRRSALNLLPKILKPSLRLLPFQVQKSLLMPALQAVFKEAIEDGDFEFLTDKWLKISITDIDQHWWLSFQGDSLIMASPKQAPQEDVHFSATGDDLLLIAGRKQDPDTLFFQRRLHIEGDTELGLAVKNLIDAIDVEQLPSNIHKVIDILAEVVEQTHQEMKLMAQ